MMFYFFTHTKKKKKMRNYQIFLFLVSNFTYLTNEKGFSLKKISLTPTRSHSHPHSHYHSHSHYARAYPQQTVRE